MANKPMTLTTTDTASVLFGMSEHYIRSSCNKTVTFVLTIQQSNYSIK